MGLDSRVDLDFIHFVNMSAEEKKRVRIMAIPR